jgi:hypothetical protein
MIKTLINSFSLKHCTWSVQLSKDMMVFCIKKMWTHNKKSTRLEIIFQANGHLQNSTEHDGKWWTGVEERTGWPTRVSSLLDQWALIENKVLASRVEASWFGERPKNARIINQAKMKWGKREVSWNQRRDYIKCKRAGEINQERTRVVHTKRKKKKTVREK